MNVAFIPVRGGSKSIPLKNIKPISGKPMVYWAVKAACECKYIDRVYVATDSDIISKTVNEFKDENEVFSKLQVIGRSAESASDTASTESAMLEFAENYDFDNIVLIQATSPLISHMDLDKGFENYADDTVDSIISTVRQKRFYWDVDNNGFANPINYDVYNRPRRQEFDGCLVENGAFYITSKSGLIKSKNRVSGNIKAVEMDEDTFFEIDEPSDWLIIEALMNKRNRKLNNKHNYKIFLTDCDGCLTDGGMYYSENGDELKKFNTRDGMAFSLLKSKGILVGVITSEDVELNRRRAEKLNLDIYEAGCIDKKSKIIEICKKYGVALEEVVYIGDDINDLESIKTVGLGCCPSDAMDEIKKAADYIASVKGGQGVIREVADMILK